MEHFDRDKFFPKGKAMLHSDYPRKTDAKLNKEEALQLTKKANTIENLTRNFIDIDPVFREFTNDGEIVQIMRPTTPYGYGGVMVVAVGKDIVSPRSKISQEIAETKTIFDFSERAQSEYFAQLLACIKAEEQTQLPREQVGTMQSLQVVAYENVAISVSNEQHRIPRSIALPHAHVIKSGSWINESHEPSRGYGFRKEQELLRSETWFGEFKNLWEQETRKSSDDTLALTRVTLRQTEPFGYTVHIGIHSGNVREQSHSVADVLRFNHKLYAHYAEFKIARANADRSASFDGQLPRGPRSPVEDSIIPQPTYRLYVYYNNGEVCVTISPQFLFPVGAFEAMNLDMDRDVAHPIKFGDEELNKFHQALKYRVHELLMEKSIHKG